MGERCSPNSVDYQQNIRKLNELFEKLEADIAFTWGCIDALNNGKKRRKYYAIL